MGYASIDNLYKNQTILMFKECYAMEKIHGTSANIRLKPSVPNTPYRPEVDETEVVFYGGGETTARFASLFELDYLKAKYKTLKCAGADITVYGEAYGGKQQGMSETYGKELKFVVFEVQVGDTFLAVPDAEEVAKALGLEFVAYERVSTDVAVLDAQRDLPSRQAKRNGIAEDKIAEGVVLRPLLEFKDNRGNRIICKHKRGEFSERTSKRDALADPVREKALADAEAIAFEWVTATRLEHVLAKLPSVPADMTGVKAVMDAMIENVYREGKGEIIESKEASRAIGGATSKLFRTYLQKKLHETT